MRTAPLALVFLLGAVQIGPLPEREAIERAKNTIVRSVDSTLPNETLETWLRDLFGSGAKVAWEVNDCGEQTGDPQRDRDRDFPMCVDASVSLDRGRVLHLLLAVGSFKTGVRREPPTFAYGVVLEAGGPTQWLKSLREASTIRRPPDGSRPSSRSPRAGAD
jgi:hypothetical protein